MELTVLWTTLLKDENTPMAPPTGDEASPDTPFVSALDSAKQNQRDVNAIVFPKSDEYFHILSTRLTD